MRQIKIKKKMKNTVIGGTFVLALVAYVASIGSIGEPGFTWDKLPVVLIVAGVSLAYIMLVGYANKREPVRQKDSAITHITEQTKDACLITIKKILGIRSPHKQIHDPIEKTDMMKIYTILEREELSEVMAYFKVCGFCGANLDPGERCDCLDKTITEKKNNYSDAMKNLEAWIRNNSSTSTARRRAR